MLGKISDDMCFIVHETANKAPIFELVMRLGLSFAKSMYWFSSYPLMRRHKHVEST